MVTVQNQHYIMNTTNFNAETIKKIQTIVEETKKQIGELKTFDEKLNVVKTNEKMLRELQIECLNNDETNDETNDLLITSNAILMQLRKKIVADNDIYQIEQQKLRQRNMFASKLAVLVNVETLPDELKPLYDELYKFLFDHAKIEIALPPNVSGEKLKQHSQTTTTNNTTSIKSQIGAMLLNGVTHQQLIDAGFNSDTIRSVVWQLGYNKNNVEGGVYVKKS